MLLAATLLGTVALPLSAQTTPLAVRDYISERENFKKRDSHQKALGFALLQANEPRAIVVLPEVPFAAQEYAAQELVEHVFQATGVHLSIVRENAIPANQSAASRIYIGGVNALRAIGVAGMAGQNDVAMLPPAQIKVLAPDSLRQVSEVSASLWQAANRPGGEGQRDGYIDVVLDQGEKHAVKSIVIQNRDDTATNYNIGRVQLAVGAADDGQSFEQNLAAGTPLPASNAAGVQRHLNLATPQTVRYIRLRIEGNFAAGLDNEKSTYSVVWGGLGTVEGKTTQRATNGLFDLETLPPNSFIVRSQGNALFLAGRDENGPALQTTYNAGSLFAVYEWLERQLGVRWIWPGELGTYLPKTQTLTAGQWDVQAQPPLLHTRMRQTLGRRAWFPAAGGYTEQQRTKVIRDEAVWYRRQRYASGVSLEYGHGYEDMWDRYATTHPEYFNLLPDGTRRSDPFYHGGAGRLISMSVATPGFQDQVIEDWKTRRSATKPWINGWENDTSGKCLCAQCLAWDVKDPALGAAWDSRLDNARRAFENKEPGWERHLGSASDRYARYYMALQEKGRATDPGATVIGGAYANYSRPPLQTKLNRNIVVGVVPEYGWPMDDKTHAGFSSQWLGWRKAGVSLYLRPNYTLWGHEQPFFTARDYARDFQLAYQNGMIATDYDSLTSMWSTQGPSLYVLSRLHWRPDWTVEKILDEYYSLFGPARTDVQRYFAFWEKHTQDAARSVQAASAQDSGALLFGGWAEFHRNTAQIFKPADYQAAAVFLNAAAAAAGTDDMARQRVEFLQSGLEDARLVHLAVQANEEFKRTTKDENLIAAIGTLDRHRVQMAQKFPNFLNLDLAAWMENRVWNRAVYSAINIALENGTIVSQLPREWRLRWDEKKEGTAQQWFQNPGDDTQWHPVRVDAPWEAQSAGKAWRAVNENKDYDGLAWYRVRFKVDEKWRGQKLALLFGAVDESATVYLNGQKVGARPFVNPNDWQVPFTMDVGDALRFDGENELMVLVEDTAGAGGVWKPVWLVAPK